MEKKENSTNKSLVSKEERRFIGERIKGSFYILGLLATIRKQNLPLSTVYEEAISLPNSPEHEAPYIEARDFLIEHAKRFGIRVTEDQKPSVSPEGIEPSSEV